ncbi:MAG: hypothetical protein QN720_04200, partial [Nitrososphaeraceae archaeon]|nr:hypothetical protein [Nitrososphaeraceae archaeon]MDW0332141.1 hypothetical protein [Nitrososphaeraceae archaeon]
ECVLRLIINVIIRTAVIGITSIQRSLIMTNTVKATWRKSYYLLIYSPLVASCSLILPSSQIFRGISSDLFCVNDE